jgi:hypothetical protein
MRSTALIGVVLLTMPLCAQEIEVIEPTTVDTAWPRPTGNNSWREATLGLGDMATFSMWTEAAVRVNGRPVTPSDGRVGVAKFEVSCNQSSRVAQTVIQLPVQLFSYTRYGPTGEEGEAPEPERLGVQFTVTSDFRAGVQWYERWIGIAKPPTEPNELRDTLGRHNGNVLYYVRHGAYLYLRLVTADRGDLVSASFPVQGVEVEERRMRRACPLIPQFRPVHPNPLRAEGERLHAEFDSTYHPPALNDWSDTVVVQNAHSVWRMSTEAALTINHSRYTTSSGDAPYATLLLSCRADQSWVGVDLALEVPLFGAPHRASAIPMLLSVPRTGTGTDSWRDAHWISSGDSALALPHGTRSADSAIALLLANLRGGSFLLVQFLTPPRWDVVEVSFPIEGFEIEESRMATSCPRVRGVAAVTSSSP